MEINISAIVMASGFSRRMQGNKLLLPFKGKPMLKHVLDTLESLGNFHEIIAVTSDLEVAAIVMRPNIKTLDNPMRSEGQSAALRVGVEAATGTHYMFFAGDMPCVSPALIENIRAFADENHIIAAAQDGRPKLPCLFPKMYREELLAVTGDQGGRQVREKYRDNLILIPADDIEMMDIDTPEDYAHLVFWIALLRSQ